jgi:hypothetical protein
MLVGLAIILISIVLFYFNVRITDLKWKMTKYDWRIQELMSQISRLEIILQDNGINPVEHKTVDTGHDHGVVI